MRHKAASSFGFTEKRSILQSEQRCSKIEKDERTGGF
jgi:hypothetical protein